MFGSPFDSNLFFRLAKAKALFSAALVAETESEKFRFKKAEDVALIVDDLDDISSRFTGEATGLPWKAFWVEEPEKSPKGIFADDVFNSGVGELSSPT